jgi:hypothetical protein
LCFLSTPYPSSTAFGAYFKSYILRNLAAMGDKRRNRLRWLRFDSQDSRLGGREESKEDRDLGGQPRAEIGVVVIGDDDEHGLDPKWKNMEWWQAGMIMIVCPSLILSFPI